MSVGTATSSSRAVAGALAGATSISFSAILYRLSEVSPLTAGFYRMAYAIPALGVLWWMRRGSDHRTRRERAMALAAGGFLALDVATWNLSIEMLGAGLATLVVNSQVVIVPIVTWIVFDERPRRSALLAMPVAIAGLALITGLGRPGAYGARPVLGVMLALMAAVLYSTFLIVFRRSNRSLAPATGPLLDATIGAAVVTGLAGLALGGMELSPSWPAHGWLLGMALGPQVAGWLLIGYALPRLESAQTSFSVLLQPTLTLVWGRLIFGESASVLQLLGVGLILAGIVAVSVGQPARAQRSRSA